MIKALRNLADWLENKKCKLHFWWNNILELLKTKCQCERSQK